MQPGLTSTDLDLETLKNMPYDIINDKALVTQDHLFKLIIIGDTGKWLFILIPL